MHPVLRPRAVWRSFSGLGLGLFCLGALFEARCGVVRKVTLVLRQLLWPAYVPLRPLLLNARLGDTLWLNLGSWERGPRADPLCLGYAGACRRLALAVGRAAHLRPACALYDAGFGAGEQILTWVRDFGASRVVGSNVTAAEVGAAEERLAAEGLPNSGCEVVLNRADAARFELAARSVDAVVALDSAYHMDPMVGFLRCAHAALRDRGRIAFSHLALDDGLWGRAGPAQRLAVRFLLRCCGVPWASAVPVSQLRSVMERAGFAEIEVEDMTDSVRPRAALALRAASAPDTGPMASDTLVAGQVLSGFASFVEARQRRVPGLVLESGWDQARAAAAAIRVGERWPVVRYVLVSAEKSGEPSPEAPLGPDVDGRAIVDPPPDEGGRRR